MWVLVDGAERKYLSLKLTNCLTSLLLIINWQPASRAFPYGTYALSRAVKDKGKSDERGSARRVINGMNFRRFALFLPRNALFVSIPSNRGTNVILSPSVSVRQVDRKRNNRKSNLAKREIKLTIKHFTDQTINFKTFCYN